MSHKKYTLFIIFAVTLLSGEIALASPGHGGDVHPGTKSPETQIGLSGAAVGDDALATSSGMTREEVATLIQDIQEPEETRSLIKLTLLALALAGVIQLYSPRRPSPNTAATSAPEMPTQTPEHP